MPTLRQKRAAKLVIENIQAAQPLTGGEIVEHSGFGPSMKKNPKVVLESKGVQNELIALGFHPDKAKEVIAEILVSGEEPSRLKAADMVFKVHGTYAAEKHINLNINESTERSTELGNRLLGLLGR